MDEGNLVQDIAGREAGIARAGEQKAKVALQIERRVGGAEENLLRLGFAGANRADVAESAVDPEPGKADRHNRGPNRRVVAVLVDETEGPIAFGADLVGK